MTSAEQQKCHMFFVLFVLKTCIHVKGTFCLHLQNNDFLAFSRAPVLS
jgi:hypothetical protein